MTEPKAIIVTGASRGIGAAIALALAARGHTVGCVSRRGSGPEEADCPAGLRDRLIGLAADVVDHDTMAAAFAAFAERTGRLDGLVNNAGIHAEARSADQSLDGFAAMLRVNTLAPFASCQLAYPHMKSAGGTIVNIGSMFDKMGVRRNAAYCASKAAVAAFGRCLAVEWARDRIRVLTVAPGYVATDITRASLDDDKVRAFLKARIPTGGPAAPAAIGGVVASLFGEDMPFLTGETIYVDGGMGMAL